MSHKVWPKRPVQTAEHMQKETYKYAKRDLHIRTRMQTETYTHRCLVSFPITACGPSFAFLHALLTHFNRWKKNQARVTILGKSYASADMSVVIYVGNTRCLQVSFAIELGLFSHRMRLKKR